jgi:hypothetical protein
MRQLFRALLIGAVVLLATGGPSRAQGFGGPGVEPTMGLIPDTAVTSGMTPAFASPYGGSQGYGYTPTIYWPHATGLPQFFRSYYDATVSSPYRPGSTTFWPAFGYFSSGCGPFLFPRGPWGW